MSRPRSSTTLALALIVASALGGCSASDREKEGGEGELSGVPDELRDLAIKIDAAQWKAFVRKDGEEKQLTVSSLQDGDFYGMADVEFLFVARDGKYEMLVDTQRRVGRLRMIEGSASAGLTCVEASREPNRVYTCTARGRAPEKFERFDTADFGRARGVFWLPSAAPSAHNGLVDEAIARIGVTKLKGVTGADDKPCVAEVTRGELSRELIVELLQKKDDAGLRKLAVFEAPEGAILGAAQASEFIALQSQVPSTTNHTEVRDRKLVVSRTDRDGLKIEIISSDGAGASGKSCRKLVGAE